MTDANNVTPVMQVQSASLYHSITYVDVLISSNPDDREVYRQGSVKVGSEWENLWSLSYVALAKLMNAAGIEEVANRRTDDRSHPFVCAWQYTAKWVQPDSTVLTYSGDYELDLRDFIDIGGGQTVKSARFEKAVLDERLAVLKAKLPKEFNGVNGNAANAKADSLYAGLDEAGRREVDDIAEAKALRFLVQMRQFIVQRAQTGAMERVIRKMLNLKSQYTTAELKLPFRVPRSRFDWDRLEKTIGSGEARALQQAQAMKLLGLTADDLQRVRQIEPPRIEPAAEATFREAEKITTDEVVIDDKDPDEPAADEILFRGVKYKRTDTASKALSDKETKEWFLASVVKLYPGPHYANHLKDHFGVSSAQNLTVEQLDLFCRHTINKAEYPARYAGKPKKPAKKPDGKTVESLVMGIADQMKINDGGHASDIHEAIKSVEQGIETGMFSLNNPDEIEAAVREYLSK